MLPISSKNLRQNLLLLAAGITAAIFVAEIALSLLNLPRFYKPHTYPVQFEFFSSKDGTVYYLNKTSSNIQFIYEGNPRGYFGADNEINHYTNSWGFRGREFEYDKPATTFRIAFLGDSFTFGEGVKQEDTYPEVTSKLLRQKYDSTNNDFESYNFGVGGYNISQSLFLLEAMVFKTNPGIIVLGYTLNDAEPNLFYVDSFTKDITRDAREDRVPEGLADPAPPDNLFFRLRTARMIWRILKQRELSAQTINYYNSLYEPGNPDWLRTKASLSRFLKICREEKIHCYVLLFPLLYELNDNYPFKKIHGQIKQAVLSDKSGYIHFIDLYDYLKGRDYLSLWVYPTDQHPNEITHRITAQALSEAIATNAEIEKRIKDLR